MPLIRLELLGEELRSVRGGTPVDPALAPLSGWGPDAQRQVGEAVAEALLDVPPAGFDPTLRVADRFGMALIDLDAIAPVTLRHFLDHWAGHPALNVTSSYRDELRLRLLADLAERYPHDDERRRQAAGRWHQALLRWFGHPPIDNLFYRACLSEAAYQRGEPFAAHWTTVLLRSARAEATTEPGASRSRSP